MALTYQFQLNDVVSWFSQRTQSTLSGKVVDFSYTALWAKIQTPDLKREWVPLEKLSLVQSAT